MASEESGKKSFTFTWKLENVSFCVQKTGAVIRSPSFVVDSVDQTKWYLGLYPRGKVDRNYIGFYLYRDADSKGAEKVEIRFQLELVANHVSAQDTFKYEFLKNLAYGTQIFEKREEVFVTKRSVFLPQDTLTARCKIWKSDGEMAEDMQCFARTRIGVQKRSFLWNVKNFSKLQSDGKITYRIKLSEKGSSLMSIDLYLIGDKISEQIIHFKLSLQDNTIKFSTLRLSLVDASGERVKCNQEEFWFDDTSKSKKFKFLFLKNKLMAMKSTYLPDDSLSMHWEWAFSKGIVSEDIEDVQHAMTCSESEFSNAESEFSLSNAQSVINKKIISLSDTLNDLKDLYEENFLCDVKLKTSTRVFNAHKIILSASSSVFKAMFSSDMKENNSNCVSIEDLSDDTINRMLVFIYTSNLEDLTWERALHLYSAADKYAILSLKNICSSYLKNNLSQSNACEVLLLSDIHTDGDLKSTVQNYLLKNIKDIIKSYGWKHLMETNAKIAAETLCLLHK
ncbi:unnamed protein product [Larinioides sclopetarius]|uniref:Speckle-type POZ protein n=1 Tax=Larinioides sclopetarius TaxID=280406 RepID=A0AAV2BEK7_9ARAC